MLPNLSVLARVETLLFLLTIATAAALLLKKFRIPYTIGLVPVGILIAALIGFFPRLEEFRNLQLGQELIMYVLLPALIFDASINLDVRLLRRYLYPTLMLAAPGLVIATVLTGLGMHYLGGLTMGGAMIFGALISATDPVAVISLFELVGAPRRLRILVDGESLFNDATAIAMFNVVIGVVLTGAAFTWTTALSGAWEFCWAFFGGLLAGAVLGWIMSYLMAAAGDDPHLKVALSILLAYVSFLVADRVLKVSGVMAVLGAGVMVSYFSTTQFNERARGYLRDFWAFMSFLANSAIFLLLGFTETKILFATEGGATLRMIVVGILAIQLARLVVVFGLCPLLGRGADRISFAYQLVMFWGGLRGAVPLALVFSIPADYPERTAILQITLAVVLFTLLVQGLTTRKLLHFFKLDEPDRYSLLTRWSVLRRARQAGLERLRRAARFPLFPPELTAEVTAEYEQKLQQAAQYPAPDAEADRRALTRVLWQRALSVERSAFDRYFRSGLLSERCCRKLILLNGAMTQELSEFRWPRPEAEAAELAWLTPRTADAARVREAFTAGVALAAAALEAETAIDPRLEELVPEEAANCRAFYRQRREFLQTRLQVLRERNPQALEQARAYALRYLVFDRELEVVRDAFARDELDAVDFDQLEGFIRRRQQEQSESGETPA